MKVRRYKIGIVDYGIGNISSLRYTLKNIGFDTILSSRREELNICDALILPGVGAYQTAMKKLRDTKLDAYIRKIALQGKPILGICLGMQLLGEESLENGKTEGLGLLPAKVIPLGDNKWHIGWNGIKQLNQQDSTQREDKDYYYFNHSYMMECDENIVVSYTYIPEKIIAAVKKDKITGLQFHPEKSQHAGKILLQTLLEELINA